MSASEHLKDSYASALDRLATYGDLVRAIVAGESSRRGFTDGEIDHVADGVATIVLHALSVLAQRAGTAPHATAAGDRARCDTIRNMLRHIRVATTGLADAYPDDAAHGDAYVSATDAANRVTDGIESPDIEPTWCVVREAVAEVDALGGNPVAFAARLRTAITDCPRPDGSCRSNGGL